MAVFCAAAADSPGAAAALSCSRLVFSLAGKSETVREEEFVAAAPALLHSSPTSRPPVFHFHSALPKMAIIVSTHFPPLIRLRCPSLLLLLLRLRSCPGQTEAGVRGGEVVRPRWKRNGAAHDAGSQRGKCGFSLRHSSALIPLHHQLTFTLPMYRQSPNLLCSAPLRFASNHLSSST
ncbi:hypothetical protein E2C01_025131 [Portunus trituberculatus]|uniref:Uncharacterized protein n=1 Tax=Portunus trituberculatus TaxID=210409 RepID=A0A5B7ECG0_PORTR|nr:hypothetical protein [Portunus trituberculatus]